MTTKRTKEELQQLNAKTASASLELEGKIFIVQKDKDGEIILRDELDGEICLKAMEIVISKGLNLAIPEWLINEVAEEKFGKTT